MTSSETTVEKLFLSGLLSPADLAQALIPRENWQPYPRVSQRQAWGSFPIDLRIAEIKAGQESRQIPWPHLPAELYLQYARNGNRSEFEAPYFKRRDILAALVLAEAMQGQGELIDAIANAAWSLCEESSWCLPAHVGYQRVGAGLPDVTEPILDLFAADTGSLLAWTLYLLSDRLKAVSPLLPLRIEMEIDARILTPGLERDDFWWMGFTPRVVNNWNPWINSNWLACVLLVEKDNQRRIKAVNKILRSVDRFIASYPEDGGCDEGPSYWGRAGASLFDCLELLYSATEGKLSVYDHPVIKEIGKFIYRAHIHDDYYINFADAPARLEPEGALVRAYGRRIADPHMASFGAWLVSRSGAAQHRAEHDLGRKLFALFDPTQPLDGTAAVAPFVRDVWLPETQVMVARDAAGSSQGYYLAVKGGHNDESHNHNDVGHFIIYIDGRPLIVDGGVETYSGKTFSSLRYEIWTMMSAYHSLPTINGVMQSPGRAFRASNMQYKMEEDFASLVLNIAQAYPPEAGLVSWQRRLTLNRGHSIELEESFELINPPAALALNLMTPCNVVIYAPGILRLEEASLADGRLSAAGWIDYDPGQLLFSAEELPIQDANLRRVWGNRLIRVVFNAIDLPKRASWKLRFRRELSGWVDGRDQNAEENGNQRG